MQHNIVLYVVGVLRLHLLLFICSASYLLRFEDPSGEQKNNDIMCMKVHAAMTIPLIILAILSVIGGFVGIPEVFVTGGEKLADFLISCNSCSFS